MWSTGAGRAASATHGGLTVASSDLTAVGDSVVSMSAQSVPPWARDDGSHDDGSRLELYRLAVEEYRFQVEHNWKRTQYLLAFNVAITALGVALEPKSQGGAVVVFLLGAAASVLGFAVTRVQHDYYRAARDRMRRIELSIELPDGWRADTTSTMGGRKRIVSATTLVFVLFLAVAVADIANVLVTLV